MQGFQPALAIVVLSLAGVAGSGGCARVGRDCPKACAVATACSGAEITGDATTYCAYACDISDGEATASGCEAAYEAQNACLAPLDPMACDVVTTKCADAQAAYAKCYVDFCTQNPSSCN